MNTILVIEDDVILLESVSDFLKEEGFNVIKAKNGKIGVEMASRHFPDLILCDILMPVMNGYDALKKLKSEISTSLIPFIFMTAKAEREDILLAMNMGVDDYITKPIDFDQLISKINKRIQTTQETIKRSEIKYHAVFETAYEAILLIRLSDFQLVDVNQAACIMLGYTREEMLALNGHVFIKDIEEQNSLAQKGSSTFNINDFQHVESIWEDKSKNGIPIQVGGKMVTLFSENHLLLMARDITERKVYEEQLIKAKEKAEESDHLKSSILSNISHELRTPLNGILGFSELLQEDLKDTGYYTMVENIHSSGRRLMDTLNSIITLSQLQAGKVTIIFKESDLTSSIQSMCKKFQEKADKKTIALKVNIQDDVIAYTDQQLFKLLFQQILDNAIKFTEQGEVTITSEVVREVDFEWQTIQIKDTGIGIDENFFEMIFHEFRQVSEGYARKFQGSGLGLTISKRTCDLLKGKITLESATGDGTAFTIWLPTSKQHKRKKVEEDKAATTLKPPDHKKPNKTPLVLLVEDNHVNKHLIELFLKPDFKMEHAFEGAEAVKMAEKVRYDAILMDINLGSGMDGIQATKLIKRIPGYEDVPIIAVTGYTMLGDREKLLSEGCTHYISKPFKRADFQAVVKDAIYEKGK